MVNFLNAIEQGISAAAGAKAEQDEINDVIKSLASSVESASNNAVTLVLMPRALKTSDDLLHSLAFVLSGTRYHALVLKGKNAPADIVEVAKWGQDGKGYPVKIGIASEEYHCPNQDALERALLTLVATSEFGAAMKTVAARSKSSGRAAAKSSVKAATKSSAGTAAKPSVKAATKSTARSATKPSVKAATKSTASTATNKPSVKASTRPTARAVAKQVAI
jgi:hypothetical protein